MKVLALVDGVLTEVEVAAGGSSGAPTLILAGASYSIPANTQVTFSEEIDMEEGAEIETDSNSILVEVS